jgi:hypothetical protein
MQLHLSMPLLEKSRSFGSRFRSILPFRKFSFTGVKQGVNKVAGKTLGERCLFIHQGDASVKVGFGNSFHRPLIDIHHFSNHNNKETSMETKQYLPLAVIVGTCLLASDSFAAGTNADLFNSEITKVEQLITGGYMRIGLLAVSGAAAIGGILKQNGWMFVSGIAGCAFVYFMKGWITSTFAMVV